MRLARKRPTMREYGLEKSSKERKEAEKVGEAHEEKRSPVQYEAATDIWLVTPSASCDNL